MWKNFFRKRPKPAAPQPRPVDELIREVPELARLFAALGYDPGARSEIRRIIESLKSLIRAEIPDFAAFRLAVQSAAAKPAGEGPHWEVRDRQLFNAALAAGDDQRAVLAVLNRDPVSDHVPFVERFPVRRGGEVTWLSPVEQACIVKCPSDPEKFAELLDELEGHFREPHPARNGGLRAQVVDAIVRLRRELKRDWAYFPVSIQFLEARVSAYEKDSLEPGARKRLESLRAIIEGMEKVRSLALGGGGAGGELVRMAREAAGRYVTDKRLRTPWMNRYLVSTLLMGPLLESSVRLWKEDLATVELIRLEIAGGYFDGDEIVRRLRGLEEVGLYVSSLVYGLIGNRPKPPARFIAS